MSGRRWRTRLAAAAGSLLLGGGLAVSAAPPAQADESTQVLLLLDVSGSMNEKISSGGTKFAAAKRALRDVADALPAGTQVGLRVYGSEIAEPKDENPKACTDTELVLPIGPLNKAKMNDAVDSFTAKGETPIAYSLQQSVKDFRGDGKRVLVLISDGEETCAKDPCPTAKKLAKSGVDLQFNAIGLDVGTKARQQLQCITKAGDGNYYDADNTDDLTDALRRITQRALRPFQVTGTPVQGTEDVESAPPLGPGQYKDRYDASTIERYYRITRTPGSTVTASIGSIVRPYPRQNAEQWTMTLTTPDGVACATTQATTGSWKAVTPFGASISSAQVDGATRKPAPAACATAPELTLSLKRQSLLGNDDDVAVEIVVAEEPEITNLTALPEARDGLRRRDRPGQGRQGVGGPGWNVLLQRHRGQPGHLHRLDGHRRDGVLQGSAAAGAAGPGHGDHAGPEDLLALGIGRAGHLPGDALLAVPDAAHQPGGQPARRWLGDGVGRVAAGQGPQPRGSRQSELGDPVGEHGLAGG